MEKEIMETSVLFFLFFQGALLVLLVIIQKNKGINFILLFGAWICAEYLAARMLFSVLSMGMDPKDWGVAAIGIIFLAAGLANELTFKRLQDNLLDKVNQFPFA
ncbi:hypothetical protein COV49_01950 [Candidatus Falkowbacteria bacterium CG11_big_fil_rev_8_21_14_0_20_39_10]|uniref:Uncharacterized protein n=1 Tax=Candidatus Falkowbacteria bacterium CG11_big_fil_rev_8_21_14_0_20_39_10 TaxID=1974570 RepID=A0A2M6K959_9BACT|nr:MAG: hypothetical protein COV49_01950 [Candidatus Falkowbacteria bacterium CG11_big_fil_rev_8_21_14_0_20_39_10]